MTKEEKNKILADKNSAANATAESAQQTSLNGVDKQYTDKVNSTFTVSDAQTKAEGKASNQGLVTQNLLNQDKIISNKTQAAIKSKFSTPKAVTEADAYLKGQLSKIQSGKTSYSDQINSLMSQISGRDKFSYDVDNDPLFQQALASAMNSGKSAMQDTIGQASALTGGYGSSYATSAANQAYNAFVEDAYNNLPQYYQMALDAYNAEGDEMYRQLGMYQTADETEYGRMFNAYDTTGAYRDRLYNEAYQQFRDNKSDAFASANLQLNEHGQLADNALALYDMYVNEADKMYEREFQKWDAEVRNTMQYAQMLNSDWWNQTNFDEGVRQFDQSLTEEQRQFDEKLDFEDKWNQTNFDEGVRQFDQSLTEQKRQFDTQLAEEKRQFNVGQASRNVEGEYTLKTNEDGIITKYKNPTETQYKKALEAYNKDMLNNKRDSKDVVDFIELNKYLDSIPGVDEEQIMAYVTANGDVSLNKRGYTKTKNTMNGFLWLGNTSGNIDSNDVVEDEYGNTFTLEELEKLGVKSKVLENLSKLNKDEKYKYKK